MIEGDQTGLALSITHSRFIRLSAWSKWISGFDGHQDIPDEQFPVRVHNGHPAIEDWVCDVTEDRRGRVETLDRDLLELETFALL